MNDNRQFNIQYKELILIQIIFKIIICFCIGSLLDLPRYTFVGNYINIGLNPYLDHTNFPINFYNKYPAFFFEILGLWFFLFGNTLFSLRILFLVFDLATALVLFKIGMVIRSKELGQTFAFVYLFLPFDFIPLLNGENESIGLFFVCVCLYFLLKERYLLSSLFLGFGVCYKIYPLFILLSISIYFLKKGKFKEIMIYISMVGLVFFLTSLPYLIISPNDYIESLLVHVRRKNTGTEFTSLFPFLFNYIPIDLSFTIINISWNFVIQSAVLLLITIYFIREKKISFPSDIIRYSLGYFILLTIIMLRGNITNWTWMAPFIIIRIFYNQAQFLVNHSKYVLISILIYGIVLISLIIYNIFLPYNVFQTYLSMDSLESYIQFILLNEDVFTIYEFFKFLPFFIFSTYFLLQTQPNRIIGLICLLNSSDRIMFAILKTSCSWMFCLEIMYIYFIVRIIIIIYIFVILVSKRWKLLQSESEV